MACKVTFRVLSGISRTASTPYIVSDLSRATPVNARQIRAKSTTAPLPKQPLLAASDPAQASHSSRPAPTLIPLPRPLGIPTPPNPAPRTWSQLKDRLLDGDRHTAKRKALCAKSPELSADG